MSAAPEIAGPRNDVERLLQDLSASDDVQWRVDSGDGLFILWLAGEDTPRCGCHADTWWTAGTDHWQLMAQFGAVRQVRFVREPDLHSPGHETLSVRLIGPNGSSALRASFVPLYDAQDQPLAAPWERWQTLRAQYGDRDETPVENGMLLPPVR